MDRIVVVLCLWVAVSFAGCQHAETGAEGGVDSLFLGISLGMEKQAFYEHCWGLNQQKILVQGAQPRSVEYMLREELSEPVMMRFYPSFHEERIYEMPVIFCYESWAPWNREYWADTLLTRMRPVFERWYGGKFEELEHPTMGTVYYRLDGHRRINLFQRDDQYVQAIFTDLRVERALKSADQQEREVKPVNMLP